MFQVRIWRLMTLVGLCCILAACIGCGGKESGTEKATLDRSIEPGLIRCERGGPLPGQATHLSIATHSC
jgi:hypothetical protein